MTVYINGVAIADLSGYVSVGSGAPRIKMVKLTGTTGANEGDRTDIAHGLADRTKIIGAQVLVYNSASNNPIPPNFTSVGEHEYDFFSDGTYVRVYLADTNSGSIRNSDITVLIIYEE